MAITTLNGYIASAKQNIQWVKTGALTTVGASFSSPFAVAGSPGAGTLAGSSTAAGVVPTDATTGYPNIFAFGVGNTGYLSKVQFSSSVACRITLYDRLFLAGAYAFNANTNLSAQPSYASRDPSGVYENLELWAEQVTNGTLVQNINVTYNDAGDVSRTTGTVAAPAAMIAGRSFQLPLAAGGQSIKTITNVTGSVASAGTFNVMVLRRLWSGRVRSANDGDVHDLLRTGLVQVYENSALYALVSADSTALGLPSLLLQIANG